jgi:hypothetical protein
MDVDNVPAPFPAEIWREHIMPHVSLHDRALAWAPTCRWAAAHWHEVVWPLWTNANLDKPGWCDMPPPEQLARFEPWIEAVECIVHRADRPITAHCARWLPHLENCARLQRFSINADVAWHDNDPLLKAWLDGIAGARRLCHIVLCFTCPFNLALLETLPALKQFDVHYSWTDEPTRPTWRKRVSSIGLGFSRDRCLAMQLLREERSMHLAVIDWLDEPVQIKTESADASASTGDDAEWVDEYSTDDADSAAEPSPADAHGGEART